MGGKGSGGMREAGPGKVLGRPPIPHVSGGLATRVLALTARSDHPPKPPRTKTGEPEPCGCELCEWWDLLHCKDEGLRFRVRSYLTDKRDGKAAQSVIQT